MRAKALAVIEEALKSLQHTRSIKTRICAKFNFPEPLPPGFVIHEKLNFNMMIDPEEKDEQAQGANEETKKPQSNDTENTNWDKHQQIDEEGNEVGPDDIKKTI